MKEKLIEKILQLPKKQILPKLGIQKANRAQIAAALQNKSYSQLKLIL